MTTTTKTPGPGTMSAQASSHANAPRNPRSVVSPVSGGSVAVWTGKVVSR